MEVDEEVKQDQDATREQFEVELEFVLCLANPAYLNCTVYAPL